MLNGKFIALVDYKKWMTKGKIYEFKDGIVEYDDGLACSKYASLEDHHKANPDFKFAPYSPKGLLQMGRIVKHQNGDWGFILKNSILYPHGLNPIHIFREDLTTPSGKYDITEIYESIEASCFNYDNFIEYLGELVWKHEELTPEQIELKAIEKELRETSEKMEQLADKLAQLDNVK